MKRELISLKIMQKADCHGPHGVISARIRSCPARTVI